MPLDGSWSVLLYTDGLIEGRIGQGSERLGSEGLMELIRQALPAVPEGGRIPAILATAPERTPPPRARTR